MAHGDDTAFADDVDRLLSTMGQVDPLDLLQAPEWLPRLLQRLRGRPVLEKFRKSCATRSTSAAAGCASDPDSVPEDFVRCC
jgi:hypothetical protein